MTEKRFTMKGSTILECGEEITAWDCCDLLNELHEENEQLKESVYSWSKSYNRVYEENEQLKQRNNFLKKQLDRVCSENEIIGDKLKKIGRIL